MWIKLDFTPLYIGGLLIGLLLIAIGLVIRATFPKVAVLGIVIAVVGAIPALVGAALLVGDRFGKLRETERNRTWNEWLPEDREIQGIRLPRGTNVEWLGQPARLSAATLAHPLQILGIPFEGEVKFVITFTNGDLHVATDLEKGMLSEDRLIDGVPCKAHQEVEFFRAQSPDPEKGKVPKISVGKLSRCTLSTEFAFKGNRFQADSEVTFNAFDGVEKGILASDQEVDGHLCKGGTEVLRPESQATNFTLARDETIGGVACKAGTKVVLERMTYHVASATLSHDQTIAGIPCKGGEAVGFGYGGGTSPLDSCVLSRAATIMDLPWPAESRITGLSMIWLQVIPPLGAKVTIGEVVIVGRCKINMKKAPFLLDGIEAMDQDTSYVEFRGGHFSELNFFEGSGYGHLAQAATVEGVDYGIGALVRFPAPK